VLVYFDVHFSDHQCCVLIGRLSPEMAPSVQILSPASFVCMDFFYD
jgi:hypothetical protein